MVAPHLPPPAADGPRLGLHTMVSFHASIYSRCDRTDVFWVFHSPERLEARSYLQIYINNRRLQITTGSELAD